MGQWLAVIVVARGREPNCLMISPTLFFVLIRHCRERGAKALEERLGQKKGPNGDVETGADGEPIQS